MIEATKRAARDSGCDCDVEVELLELGTGHVVFALDVHEDDCALMQRLAKAAAAPWN